MNYNHRFRSCYAVERYSASREMWDTPLFESDSFVGVPTIGPLVEGWLLIVPREPLLAFAELSPCRISELNSFLKTVMGVLRREYGPVAAFEHGPSSESSAIGCGVDYAHISILPVDFNLLDEARRVDPGINWREISSIADLQRYAGAGYWFLQQPAFSRFGYVGVCQHTKPKSQLFRRAVANHIGCPAAYDWKENGNEHLIRAMIERLGRHAIPA